MLKIGYTLSAEEHQPQELINNAEIAEKIGFSFVSVSDHFHPWVEAQGESSFVWNIIGALSQKTKTVNVLIGVNCPAIRYHPALIAQAAATSQVMLEGRFVLGFGTGENLNEHVVGMGWPPIRIRREMLGEAIEIIRKLMKGDYISYYGSYYQIDSAKIFTLPKNPIPLIVAASGPNSAKFAGNTGDGFITTSPNKQLIDIYNQNGGKGKPIYGQFHTCYHKDKQKAREIVKKLWPNSAMPEPLGTELKLPKDFDNTAKLISEEKATEKIPTGPDLEPILEKINEYKQAGFDHIYIHQIGPYQKEFLDFAAKNIIPKISKA